LDRFLLWFLSYRFLLSYRFHLLDRFPTDQLHPFLLLFLWLQSDQLFLFLLWYPCIPFLPSFPFLPSVLFLEDPLHLSLPCNLWFP
jgi:hypothetical protein